MIACYDVKMKKVVWINPNCIVAMYSDGEDIENTIVELLSKTWYLVIREGSRESHAIKEYFRKELIKC